MESDDAEAWNFYMTNATLFVRDYGLMDGRIAALTFDGVANKDIFIQKLSAVHGAMMEHAAKGANEDAGKEKPDFEVEGSENG